MMTFEDLSTHIQQALGDAEVSVLDRTGTMDHFTVKVISNAFEGKNLLDRHRMIYQALDEDADRLVSRRAPCLLHGDDPECRGGGSSSHSP